jgi:DNA helicase-2/ATP-dependent DNA helicase PcrA
MSRLLEEAFIRNKIPYQVVRGVEFYSRKEIRDVLAYLRVLVNPNDEVALLRIINTPARGIGKTTIDKIRDYAAANNISFLEAIKKAECIDSLSEGTRSKLVAFANMLENFKKDTAGKVAPLAERVFVESGLAAVLKAGGIKEQDALENIKELIKGAAEYDERVVGTVHELLLLDYLQQISLFSDVDAYDASSDRVALMTLHAAKGLEFENVFIVGVEDGLLPHARTDAYKDDDELEEERRLFFVGITRAKTGLNISYAKYRTIRGQMLRTIPSQFLFELGIDLTEAAQGNQYCHDDTDNTVHPVIPAQAGIHCLMPSFTAGQRVRHKLFGTGIVKEFIDMGENSVVVVKFNTGQTKTLMVKYADLLTI